jgi:methionyl-tRNA formyltransferase
VPPTREALALLRLGEVEGIERVLFFGTPEFAVPTLAALVAAGSAPILVATQPARPAGRGGRVQDPPVAAWARQHGLAVEQPRKVRDPAFLDRLAALRPEVAVVVAFGQIFPQRLLDLPRLGCVNLHASLLPKYRGAAPIQAAIAAGERKTGITTMRMVAELDAGPILLQEEVEIGPRETAGELSVRLADRGAALVIETLRGLAAGTLAEREQNHAEATSAPRLSKADGLVDWELPATRLADRLRALTPWPGLTGHLRGETVKLVAGVAIDWEEAPSGTCGTYLGMRQGRLAVLCGAGTLLGIERLQRPGRKPVSASDFAHGERLAVGERFA